MPVLINKSVSITPLEAIQRFKRKCPKYNQSKIGYAGRLDPMAHGLLLLLINNENKQFNKFSKLDKQYRAKILLGIQTDSYDILGIPIFSKQKNNLKQQLHKIKTSKSQTLPPYSSYRIKGKPLFYYAKHKNLPKILPRIKINIKKLKLNKISYITNKKLFKQIQLKISKLNGDFRQKQILNSWKKLLKESKKFQTVEIILSCFSGTYIRSIADKLKGTLIDLERQKIGKFSLKDAVKI